MDFVHEEQEKSRNLIGTIINKIEEIKPEIQVFKQIVFKNTNEFLIF